jgi:hypothetical protein
LPPRQQQQQQVAPPPRPVDPRAAFNDYASANEISEYDADNLYNILSVASVGFLIDDSSSMRKPIVPEGANAFALAAAAASGVPQPTRWSEACKATQQIAELAGALKSGEGVDLHFMNRQGPAGKVRTGGEINKFFLDQPVPGSGTPMLGAIRAICASNEVRRARRYLLVIITDGEPNDGAPMSESITQLRDLLSRTPSQMYTTMVECTDNKESMDYLEGWNGQVPRFDNTEAYAEEVVRIRNIQQNPLYRFTYTDYVIKILMGAFREVLGAQASAKYCSIDMVRINQSQQQSASQYRQQQPQQAPWRPSPEQKTASDNFSSAAAPPQQQQQQPAYNGGGDGGYDPRWPPQTQSSSSPPPPRYDPPQSQYAPGHCLLLLLLLPAAPVAASSCKFSHQ